MSPASSLPSAWHDLTAWPAKVKLVQGVEHVNTNFLNSIVLFRPLQAFSASENAVELYTSYSAGVLK